MKIAMPFLATQKEATYAMYLNSLATHRCPELIHSSHKYQAREDQGQNEFTLIFLKKSIVQISLVEFNVWDELTSDTY